MVAGCAVPAKLSRYAELEYRRLATTGEELRVTRLKQRYEQLSGRLTGGDGQEIVGGIVFL